MSCWIRIALVCLGLLDTGRFVVGETRQLDASQVKLLPGSPFYDRQQLHRVGYLADYEPDKLLFHYSVSRFATARRSDRRLRWVG